MKAITHNGVPCVLGKMHMLATEDEGTICIRHDKPYVLIPRSNVISPVILTTHNHYHLYITTDEEIKEGDWIMYKREPKRIEQAVVTGDHLKERWSKIISTTDPKLTVNEVGIDTWKERKDILYPNKLPQIPQLFIEDYCNNPVDEVWIEVEEEIQLVNGYKNQPKDVIGFVASYEPTGKQMAKLNSNNEIIIHNVEEKMYSHNQIKAAVTNAVLDYTVKGYSKPVHKWIEENL